MSELWSKNPCEEVVCQGCNPINPSWFGCEEAGFHACGVRIFVRNKVFRPIE
jgi:hypothetical protein